MITILVLVLIKGKERKGKERKGKRPPFFGVQVDDAFFLLTKVICGPRMQSRLIFLIMSTYRWRDGFF
jgi:hypothetical protein